MKGKQELYLCMVCGEKFFLRTLKKHIKKEHGLEWKEYFDFYIDNTDHTCPICHQKERVFKDTYYQKTCGCAECCSKYRSIHNGGGTKESIEKAKKTKFEKYGDEYFNNVEKCKQTCLEKYGVSNAGGLEQSIKKIKQTKFEKYGDENYCNKEKARKTRIEKYGCFFNNIEKAKITNKEKYGVEYPGQIESGKIKARKTRIEKYGENNINNIKKQKNTLKEKYGVENVSQIDFVKKKRAETMLERFGSTCNLSNPINRSFLNYPVEYNGETIYFDSIPEILFWEWNIENDIDIKRESTQITYFIDGIKHTYIPDFEIDGILYEIKRDDLVKDGWIVLDFCNKEKELIDKSLSMKENNVKILLVSDVYKKYFPKNGNEIIKKVRKFRKDKKYEC